MEEVFRFDPSISERERFPMGRPSQEGIDILIAPDPNRFYVPQPTNQRKVQILRKKRNIVYKRKD